MSRLTKGGAAQGEAAPAEAAAVEEEMPESLPPAGAPVVSRTVEEWEVEGAKLLEADLAANPPKSPTKVGTVTNWEGYTCEIWYYPTAAAYGVVCPFDHDRDSGATYRDSTQAKIYAESTLGMTSR